MADDDLESGTRFRRDGHCAPHPRNRRQRLRQRDDGAFNSPWRRQVRRGDEVLVLRLSAWR
jgi:hypothetical protein